MSGRVADVVSGLVAMTVPMIIGASLVLVDSPAVNGVRNLVFDSYQRIAPRPYDERAPVRVIDIDDESLRRLGQWPWPRYRMAQAVRRLADLGATVIGVDVILAEADRTSPEQILAGLPDTAERRALAPLVAGRSHDAVLAATLATAPAVMGLVLVDDPQNPPPPPKAGFVELGDRAGEFVQPYSGAVTPLPAFVAAASGLGAVNWRPDRDLVVRRVPLVFGAGEKLMPSLALEALRVASGTSSIAIRSSNASGAGAFGRRSGINAVRVGAWTIPTDPDGSLRVRYAGTRHGRHIPFWRLLEPNLVTADDIRGRIVLIGTGASALGDIRATPLEESVPGVDIHAELIEQVLDGRHLVRPDHARGIEIVVLALGCLFVSLLVRGVRPTRGALATVAIVLAVGAGSWLAFSRLDLLIDPVLPSAAILTTFVGTTVLLYRRTEGERRQIRNAFGHYVSPEIVEAIAADPGGLRLGGQTKPLTILFSDLRGFTSRSESMTAESVIRFLNGMHTPLTHAVLSERGTIDKYIGDGLMAFWNAPLDVEDHVSRSCAAALRMMECLPEIEAALALEIGFDALRDEPIGLGIGIHTGVACVGNMGSALRFDYSIVGDAVNTAARLEPLTKLYGVPIVVSEEVASAARGFVFVPLDVLRLKGQARETRILALVGRREAVGRDYDAFLRLHEIVLDAVLEEAPERESMLAELEKLPQAAAFAQTYQVWRQDRDGIAALRDVTPPVSRAVRAIAG